MNVPAISMTTTEFLQALWPAYQGTGYLNVWTAPAKITHPFALATQLDAVEAEVQRLTQDNQHVYFQVGLQASNTGSHGRGKEVTTVAIPGFWHDTDIAGPGHKQANLPEDLAAAKDLIFSLPLPPTLIVYSGGGIYPFWLFKNPWEFTDDADREKAKALSVRFQTFINIQGSKRGYKLDSTANLDRLLRIPGSQNMKDLAHPRPVQVISYEPANRYTPYEIEQAIPPVTNAPAVAKQMAPKCMATTTSPQFPLADFEKVKANCSWVYHCVVDAVSLPEPEWHAVLSIICRCQDGHAKAHEISRPYHEYSEAETDRKIANAENNAGPRTCANIRSQCGGEEFCSACSYWGKITSPIQLGTHKTRGTISVAAELVLPNAPVAEGTMIPPGYSMSLEKGVWRLDGGGKGGAPNPVRVCPVPIVIVSRSRDINSGTEFIDLAWFKDSRWNCQTTGRRTIADTREILQLASYGLPVTSLSSKDMVRYLEDYENANDTIPLVKSSSHLGWQSDTAFLWGEELLMPSGDAKAEIVGFRAQDDGDAQIAKGFTSRGKHSDWLAMANALCGFLTVFITVMAALSAPFLWVFRVANFVIDIAGETSKGKTTAQIAAASSWGNPTLSAQNSILNTWDATDVWFERTAALLNGLPLMLDDTKTARSDDVIGDFVYRFTSGKGKGRGTLTGTRGTGTWQSILISSGEQSINDYTQRHGGVKARVLSQWGSPFGNGSQGALVKQVEMLAKDNYGHAGPIVVQFILDHRDDWPLWREAYREILRSFSERADGNGVATRLSEIIAFFAVTIPLIHAALPGLSPTRPIREILDDLWPAVMQGTEQADKAREALKTLWEWSVANQAKFWCDHKRGNNGPQIEPNQGWAGRWDYLGTWTFLAVTKRTLDLVLKDFEVQAMVKTWAERGWLDMPKNQNKYQKSKRINGTPCDTYAIPKTILAQVLEMDLTTFDNSTANCETFR